jgi:hypothetical protein
MSSRVEKAKGQYGLMERILSYVPGYRGYKEKEIRRETDRLVRMAASSRLKKALDNVREALSKVPVSGSDRELAERVVIRLDMVKQKTERAVAGYAGLFDVVKVREDRLDQLIEHDEKLITSAEGILQQSMAIKSASSPDELRSRLQQLLDSIDGYGELLERRNEIIKEL